VETPPSRRSLVGRKFRVVVAEVINIYLNIASVFANVQKTL